MTKKLSELFDLPSTEESAPIEAEIDPLLEPILDNTAVTTAALSNLEKIEAALPQVTGLNASDVEMDSLADLAIKGYRDMMDLGMQVDSRFSAEIFAVGGTMLGHALTAKTAKINKRLKTIELQLKKAALDAKLAEQQKGVQATPVGTGRVMDRNELLKMFSKGPSS